MVMKQMKHLFAIAFALLMAMPSTIPLVYAGHGFGGHGLVVTDFTDLAVTAFTDLVATGLLTTRLVGCHGGRVRSHSMPAFRGHGGSWGHHFANRQQHFSHVANHHANLAAITGSLPINSQWIRQSPFRP